MAEQVLYFRNSHLKPPTRYSGQQSNLNFRLCVLFLILKNVIIIIIIIIIIITILDFAVWKRNQKGDLKDQQHTFFTLTGWSSRQA